VRILARDVRVVARFELGEAVRTRLLMVMVLLFVGAGATGAWGYSRIISAIEENAARVTGAPAPRRGSFTRRLRESRGYQDMLRAFLRDEKKAAHFAAQPPIVVFFGWASFAFVPWLVLFTSAETIAGEVSRRSIRYAAMRTGRLVIALGKLAGHLVILAGVTALSAVAFFLVAWAAMPSFEAGVSALGLLSFWPRVVLYALPFLSWAMLASMVTASTNGARAVALGGATVLSIVGSTASSTWIRERAGLDPLWDLLGLLVPFGHSGGLFYPPGGALPLDVAVCLCLAVLYFAAGFVALRRRDL
jgi:ABC-type transport system involved in multi-copper enzyme maturation permease subunit